MPQNTTALQITTHAEATCYSLPYGGIGFTSHIITYYTMVMLILGRQPLPPFRPLKRQLWSNVLGTTQLIATIVLSAIAMHRCQAQWEFMLLAVWMLTTSICLSVLTIVAPHIFSRDAIRNGGAPAVKKWHLKANQTPQPPITMTYSSGAPYLNWSQPSADLGHTPVSLSEDSKPFGKTVSGQVCIALSLLWLCGCILGVVAIEKITVAQEIIPGPLFIESAVFGGLAFFGLQLIVIKYMYCCMCRDWLSTRLLLASVPVTICVFSLLWMDWTLGLATGNLVGVPAPSAKALYWTYIAVKRLGLFSM